MMEADGARQFLPIMVEQHVLFVAISMLLIVMPLLLAVAGLGFFQMTRFAGTWTWIALFAFLGGASLIIYRGAIWLAVSTVLAPAYNAAADASQSNLAAVGDTLERFALVADMVGGVLVAGIGAPLFSVAAVRDALIQRWVGWLGLMVAVLGGWMTLLTPFSELAGLVSFVGFVGFWIWMAAMGAAVWKTTSADRLAVERTPAA